MQNNIKSPAGIHVSIENYIATLTLNRPEKANAIDHEMHIAIPELFLKLRKHDDVRVVVIASEGNVFSAGGDLEYIERLASDREYRRNVIDIISMLYKSIADFPKPVIASVRGAAVGIGATIATACDIVVAVKGAQFSDPHVRIGLSAGDGGVASWSSSVGILRAKRYLLTGDAITAEQAFQFGLVTDLVDSVDELGPLVDKLAAKIASYSPVAVQGTKRAFNQLVHDYGNAAFQMSLLNEIACLDTEDIYEALAAARERRPANFRGK